jgi:hypothetical protein
MRFIAALLTCVAVALTLAGCDPVTERRYITEGAGVDLYTADREQQIALQNQYIDFICAQAGQSCPDGNWTTFVQAGMNDIDQRCDGYLTWLDGRRRDREPVLAELSALNAATHAIMTVTGSSPTSLDIVTAAFGLASATFSNWNSRLLLAVNQSTVQDVVYTSQGQFRDKIKVYVVPDRPMAIYLLRNYLRLCMPITIEANINTTTTLVQRGAPLAAVQGTVVKTITPAPAVRIRVNYHADDATTLLRNWLRPNGATSAERVKMVNDFLVRKQLNPKPFVATFLTASQYAAERAELARELGLH